MELELLVVGGMTILGNDGILRSLSRCMGAICVQEGRHGGFG